MTPSRHRRLVLAYDSNPLSDGSVLASASARAASSLSAYTTAAAAAPAVAGHSEARCNQWKHHRIKKNADAALQAAQTVLALYSEATRREMFTLAPHPYNGVHCTHLHAGTSATPQWGKRGIWG
ncbi:hypothetical protein EMIHUDRAFT_235414 [Emiliania huxleyi CCMP1516]|uniref:Uncharacterized protein n=2 Tax=Emiliania huxleyi TaxID=2903 RepID=A0A0D3JWR3_EMIH1|nr:hypothetical protein EMIHUDRAFT_235414 [Emiliania huxleyi CCMP1516]EOD27948.1 hypothetical protein EMIHUDRAFT_235414 [Emiliania huxleyi CCMP1516]|eukprot:XP_005780377.1 hypothetical protein EMIHUDRAFT_235414 [Emiliania huxleyi CCMP1516]